MSKHQISVDCYLLIGIFMCASQYLQWITQNERRHSDNEWGLRGVSASDVRTELQPRRHTMSSSTCLRLRLCAPTLALIAALAFPPFAVSAGAQSCPGDCDMNGEVS